MQNGIVETTLRPSMSPPHIRRVGSPHTATPATHIIDGKRVHRVRAVFGDTEHGGNDDESIMSHALQP